MSLVTGTVATATQNSITTATGLTTVGAGGTASTVAGIPFYSASQVQFIHMMFLEQMILHQTILPMELLPWTAITTGDNNAAFGHNALGANTTGAAVALVSTALKTKYR